MSVKKVRGNCCHSAVLRRCLFCAINLVTGFISVHSVSALDAPNGYNYTETWSIQNFDPSALWVPTQAIACTDLLEFYKALEPKQNEYVSSTPWPDTLNWCDLDFIRLSDGYPFFDTAVGINYRPRLCPNPSTWSFYTKSCTAQKYEKNLGGCICGVSCVGNPINVAIGNKYQRETDLRLRSLSFMRSYNSINPLLNGKPVSTVVGSNWNHNFERYVIADAVDQDLVHVTRPDGKSFEYRLVDTQWVADADVRDKLERLTDDQGILSGWRYTTTKNSVEEYNALGKLVAIIDVRGNSQALSYVGNGRLARVDTDSGESLQFAYDASDRIVAITDHTGRVWAFRYDTRDNLEYVDYPDSTTKQYQYENARFPHALTGITDRRGIRYATFEYDTSGRGKASYHAGATERVDIVYNTSGTRTVTNSLGQVTTYTTASQLGTSLVTDVSGPGCTSCGDGNTSYQYDSPSNTLLSKTDNGLTTEYGDYDAKGQYGYRIEAAGTAEAQRADMTYDPRFSQKVTTETTASVYTP